ncbi:GFA family protein [Noviherbaspirillum sp.]|uniref:GFA family protein n=1 Tax=Noviherbaspirillum sp. TaxID=1926288 RepID=UPI002FE2C68C
MPTQLAGGCACGAIRYACSEPPLGMFNCHCRDCQRAGGGPFSPLMAMAASTVRIDGTPAFYTAQASGGNHGTCGFCAVCGTQLFARNPDRPDVLMIKAASLNEPAAFKPVADIWTVNALPWVHFDRHIPKVFKSPPVLEKDDLVRF